MNLLLLAGLAWAQDGPTLEVELPQMGNDRTSNDVTVFVRADGQFYYEDELVDETQLEARLLKIKHQIEGVRVLVSADPAAEHGRVVQALDRVKTAGITNVGIEVTAAGANDDAPLFEVPPGGAEELGGDVTELGTLSKKQLRKLKPKHHKFPQNPYGNTDYTAYTLELGEVKVGLLDMQVGVLPRVQLGIAPIPAALQMYNLNAKWNVAREKKLDVAFLVNGWLFPVGDILDTVTGFSPDADQATSGASLDNGYFVQGGVRGSLQIAGGWSIHGALGYAGAGLSGNIDLAADLPFIPIGADTDVLGLETNFAPKVTGNIATFRFATDYRFNRRDAIVFLWSNTLYAKARFEVGSDGVPIENVTTAIPDSVDLGVAFGGWINPAKAWQGSVAYQLSFRNLEARVGLGWSAPISITWVLGTFDIAYRFGGKTRRTQRKIKKGWKSNKQDIKNEGGGT